MGDRLRRAPDPQAFAAESPSQLGASRALLFLRPGIDRISLSWAWMELNYRPQARQARASTDGLLLSEQEQAVKTLWPSNLRLDERSVWR